MTGVEGQGHSLIGLSHQHVSGDMLGPAVPIRGRLAEASLQKNSRENLWILAFSQPRTGHSAPELAFHGWTK